MDALSSYLHSHRVKHGDERVCIPQQAIASSGAIWGEDNPLDYPYSLMMAQIILIVITSRVLYYFLRPSGQTKFI